MNKLMIPLFATTLLLTACGGSDDATNKEAIIKMAAESLEAEAGFYSEAYTECLLEGLVDITDVSWNDIKEALELDGNLDSLEGKTTPSQEAEEELLAMTFTCIEDADVFEEMMNAVIDDMMDDAR